ncbi:hypothetical protein KJ849_07435 [bacterium]|nr:hypothetical protein [bacterium]
MFKKTLIIMLGVLFLASQSFAARPLTTDDAGIVEKGTFELERGYDYTKNQNNTESQTTGLSLKHGLTDRLDFGLAFPYEIKPNKGLGSAELGVKFSLLKEKEGLPGLSSTFSYQVGVLAYTLNMILSKGFGSLTCHLNIGFEATGQVTERGITTYSGAVEYSAIKENLNLVAEVMGNEDNLLMGLIGTNFQAFKGVTSDIGLQFGFNNDSPKSGLTIGLTTEF